MKDLYNKALATIISPLFFALFMGWALHTPMDEREYECCYMNVSEGFFMTIMPAIPMYIVFGLLGAYLVDKGTDALKIKRYLYLFQLLMYTLLAILPGMFLAIASEGFGWIFIFSLFSVPASLIYYHIFLFLHHFEKWRNSRRKRKAA
ncbi:hypothetical protein [Bacillus sp. es.034]|uniref:hypothetical protein n=1 Tax=Bacillus sp. es.034 TaxID=1761763 RepID=UPI000BF3F186|nr:hypothetical protein [Bacillus sp. es.034]PFG04576.1 hypothetical protein ATG71_1364 [Bacillus sp. es.034]